ncbi:MAG: hypothetical protein EBT49_07465 [Betaproteobacteria bacterium]|nr:hypothetical protein [Betaproteobacteria bacterium]
MDANPYLIDRLLAVQEQTLDAHARLNPSAPDHEQSLSKVVVANFLQPLFSAHRRFTPGRITDAEGVLTEQLDLIVEHGFMPSFPLPDGQSRLVLAEAVALVIEVVDHIGRDDAALREKTSHLRQLRRDIKPAIKYKSAPSERVPMLLVAFNGPTEIEDLAHWWTAIPEQERPDAVCVLSSGCFLGFGMEADGALGLYSVCVTLNHMLTLLNFATPDLATYAGE